MYSVPLSKNSFPACLVIAIVPCLVSDFFEEDLEGVGVPDPDLVGVFLAGVGVFLVGVDLVGVFLAGVGVFLTGVDLVGVFLAGVASFLGVVDLVGVFLAGVTSFLVEVGVLGVGVFLGVAAGDLAGVLLRERVATL
mmetsp:Transcript_8728/g.12979  ORF Transcript_8728/g.12979 Transcript_8728/m.12979 type:complete len:137 (-) Transcript_8728:132-542(-)